ncbi:MAG: enoyl-CoA hydratase/isomerase family protein [Dehalococcoidia bacterium]|nr:enoyl-CoA hydratase/isomerase family protein [Dehalococcoidia bacterium]
MATEQVLIERSGHVAEIILNRPERKNAITGPLARALQDAIEACSADGEVRVILLRGASGVFSSGLDLKEFNADPRPDWLPAFQATWRGVHESIYATDKAVVCALEGYAINAGSALALSADFIVAGEGAFLQVGEVRQGRPAPMNLAWLSMRYGDALARRIMLLGHRIVGDELLRLGIAHDVVHDDLVLTTARALSEELAELPPAGISATKQLLRRMDLPGRPNDWFALAAEGAAELGRASGPIPSLKR